MQNVGSAPPGPDFAEASSGKPDTPRDSSGGPNHHAVSEKPDANAIENAIGGKLAVWVGAIALALGGVFLVKYSIDHGWLNETLRVLGSLGLGLGLGAASWRLRDRSNYVAQGLAAAGVIVVYASLWAATDYYNLVPPAVGLAGMVGATLAAVGLSLRLGSLVAVLGLLGAFMAPLLVGRNDPHPLGLFAYLLALQAGSQFVAYRRRWVWVSAISMGAGALWVLAQIVGGPASGDASIWPGLFLLASSGVFILPEVLKPSAGKAGVATVWAASALGSALLALTLGASEFSHWVWAFFVLLAAGTGVLAVWQQRYRRLPWMTLGITGVLATIHVYADYWGTAHTLGLLGVLGITYLSIGYAGLFRREPREFYALVAAAPAALLGVCMPHLWYPVHELLGNYGWMMIFAGTGAVYTAFAVPAVIRNGRMDGHSLTALLVPAQLFFAVAWPLGLDLQYCIFLWSGQLVLALALDRWLNLEGLRITGVLMQGALNVCLLTPVVLLLAPDLGPTPLFHWASAAYVAAIAANLGARYLHLRGDNLRSALSVSAVLLVLAGAAVNIHHAANDGNLLSREIGALEVSSHVITFLAVSLWLLWRAPHMTAKGIDDEQRVLRDFGVGLGIVSLLIGFAVVATAGNPWLSHDTVHGIPVLNTLMIGIGLPALLAGSLSRALGERGYTGQRILGWWITGGLIVLGVMLQVRHAFHGGQLWVGEATHLEHYAYSISLALLALLALALGIARNSRQLRVVALGGMLVCSAKVFGYDMGHLDGISRILSFLGLGASLMLIGYLYNRFGPKAPPKSLGVDDLPPQETILADTVRTDTVPL